jgi:hypothetical protein
MARSSRDIPTNWSPDHVHPCQVDDSDWSDEETMRRKAYALGAAVVVVPLLGAGLLIVAVLERWRAWRAGEK